MSYSSPDSSYTQLCAVYRCRCGAASPRYGRLAGFLPGGWRQISETACICRSCSERWQKDEAAGRAGPSA